MYTASLPPNLDLAVAKELLRHCQRNSKFSHLGDLCVVFVDNHTLKLSGRVLVSVGGGCFFNDLPAISELMEVVDSLVKLLETAQQMVETIDMADPAKVVYTIRQLAKLAAVGNNTLWTESMDFVNINAFSQYRNGPVPPTLSALYGEQTGDDET